MKDLFLAPCSWLFSAAIRTRHFLYDHNILTQKKAPLPVISIGNLVVGGAGKTQAALMLAGELSSQMRVAVLSRGYKGKAEHAKKPLLVNPERHSPQLCGDESWLLASRLPRAMVYSNKNRFKSALEAKKAGAELIILDDGMQHRKLHRDLEIVVIDSQSPLKHYLPQGRLREHLQRLQAAHLILFVGRPAETLKQRVSTLTSAPQVVVKITPTALLTLENRQIVSLKESLWQFFAALATPLALSKQSKSWVPTLWPPIFPKIISR